MKIIFFGSSDFAVPALEALKGKEEIVLVVTRPDRKKGRSLKMASTPIKVLAEESGIKTFQPDDVNSKSSIEYLKDFSAELFVVVSFGEILGRELLDIPRLYSINVHGSFLPKYRGAAPVNWALANGETQAGVSIIKMNEKMDEGDIVLKEAVSIDKDDDAVTLLKKLSIIGAGALLDSLDLIKGNEVKFTRQSSSEATYAPKLKKEDGLIDWSWSANKIYNRIRAFVPWPGCYTHWDGKILKIWRARPVNNTSSGGPSGPGTVLEVNKAGIIVAAGEGTFLRIEELQLEAKRRMNAEELIAGHKEISSGATLG